MKYLYLILLIIILSCGCIEDYTLTEDEKRFITELKAEYDKENVSKPYSEIHVAAVQRYDNYISVSGTVEIYNEMRFPFTPIAQINIKDGCGSVEFNKTNYTVYSHTDYYIVFNGRSDFYDKWYMGTESAHLPHHVTYDMERTQLPYRVVYGDTVTAELLFEDIVKVGYFESQEHQLINLNNQTYIEFDICVLGNHGAVKNPVICFVNDLTNPYEGHEFKRYVNSPITITPSVSLERVSGSHFHSSSDITEEVMDAGCVQIQHHTDNNGDRWIFGGYCGRCRIDFNMIRYDELTEKDIMHIYLDDLDGYLNRDIMFYAKASPVHIATIMGG